MAQETAATKPLDQPKTRSKKLGLGALTALVVSSMIGSGMFSLPQNMAAGTAPVAILISWLVTSIGILALAFVYQGTISPL